MTWTLSLSEPHDLPATAGIAQPTPAPPRHPGIPASSKPPAAKRSTHRVFVRAALTNGARIAGPAVIVEDGTSTIVPTGYTARISAGDDIVIEEIEA